MKTTATFLLLLLSTDAVALASTTPHLRTVALSGQPAPGTSSDVTFHSFEAADINGKGQVAFVANLTPNSGGVNADNDNGIWSEGDGSLGLIAREGTQAPGPPAGVKYGGLYPFARPVINDAGKVAFWSGLQTGAGGVEADTNIGIWSGDETALELVARAGDQIPGAPSGVNFAHSLAVPILNESGQTATNDRRTIVYTKAGVTTVVASYGQTAPGMQGASFTELAHLQSMGFNDNAQVAFVGRAGDDVDDYTNIGLWSDRSGALELLVKGGDDVPDIDGAYFSNFNKLAFNNQGHVAFAGIMDGPVRTGGIWSDAGGSLRNIALGGTHAPGTAAETVFLGDLDEKHIEFNQLGQILFGAYLLFGSGDVDAYNDEGIWLDRSGALEMIVRMGSPAPGVSPSNLFDGVVGYVMNDYGQIAFTAYLEDGKTGLWALDRSNAMHLVALVGSQLEVNPGDFRTVLAIEIANSHGSADTGRTSINNLGQIAFYAQFTDGSEGIFVSNLVAVPEPCSMALFALFSAAMFRPLRRR